MIAAEGVSLYIVDDDPSVRTSLTRLLRAEGADPQAFATSEEFLDFLRQIKERSPAALSRVQYIEQPTHRDLKKHPENKMHAAAKIKRGTIHVFCAELLRELLTHGARCRVDAATCRERHDNANRFSREHVANRSQHVLRQRQ